MPKPTPPQEPEQPSGTQPLEQSAPADSTSSGDRPTEQIPAQPTEQFPSVAAQQGPPPGGPPPSSPPAAGLPPAGPPPGGHVAGGPPPGVPPRRPGVWREATSTTGGRIAVAVAAGLVALFVVAALGIGTFAFARGVMGHDRAARVEQARGPWGDQQLPPGQGKRLDRMPGGPVAPRERGDGMGDGMGNGDGLGPFMRGAMGLGDVEHGEFTVTGSDGKTSTMTLQRGEVTKVSGSSITVKSSDGFTATYTTDADTRGNGAKDLSNGDQVLVVAHKDGGKAVLVRNLDR